jgi:hypothetical protein
MIGLGRVLIKLVFPAPDCPYTSILTPELAAAVPVLFSFIAIRIPSALLRDEHAAKKLLLRPPI